MSHAPAKIGTGAPAVGTSLDRFGFVTDEVRSGFERFVALLCSWQRVHNLVASSTLSDVWTRHVADSLQLVDHAPPGFSEWVDLGSGAGFPGLAVAIACKARGDAAGRVSEGARPAHLGGGTPPLRSHFTLVESNLKKAAFLRAAVRETGANAVVASERIEDHARKMAGGADVVSVRGLAPLAELCGLARPYLHAGSVMLLLKGQDFVHEHEAASKSWGYDMVSFPSTTDSSGRIVVIRNLRPKERP